MNTPYQWTKQVASHWGGTRNGTIVHWPKGITGKGELRTQFHHVIDIAPTILEAAGLPQPIASTAFSRADRGRQHAVTRSTTRRRRAARDAVLRDVRQRGIYHKGWTAVTRHKTPWLLVGETVAGVRRRQLGAVRHQQGLEPVARSGEGRCLTSCTIAASVADRGATRYNVLPLDDRVAGADEPDSPAARLIKGKTQISFGGMGRLSENSVINIKNKSHSVTPRSKCPHRAPKA
jgi:arylsulfatase